MRYISQMASVLVAALLVPSSATQAQELEIESVATLPAAGVDVQVIGGEREDPANWPATFIFRNSGGGGCTATAVGEQVILTAAHCVGNGSTGRVTFGGSAVQVWCYHHPDYIPPQSYSADFALCRTESVLPEVIAEVINTDSSRPKLEEQVQLLGYGCLTEGGIDKTFGGLWGGMAKVIQRPTHGMYTITEGGAAVCFGDSGGGSFLVGPVSRTLFAVNSRGNISERSWLSTTSAPGFLRWAEDWALHFGLSICGVNENATGCAEQ